MNGRPDLGDYIGTDELARRFMFGLASGTFSA